MPISIARLPIQPNSTAAVSCGNGMRTLAPIARPNAPLTMPVAGVTTVGGTTTGLVLRSAVGASVPASATAAASATTRPPIVLAAALNPAQQQQQRLTNPLTGIAIRAPGQPAIISQPALGGVNGVPAIPGVFLTNYHLFLLIFFQIISILSITYVSVRGCCFSFRSFSIKK